MEISQHEPADTAVTMHNAPFGAKPVITIDGDSATVYPDQAFLPQV